LLIVDDQDARGLVGVGAEAVRRLEAAKLAGPDPKMATGRAERLELTCLDPVLHGADRHLAPARDLTRRQIAHQGLKNRNEYRRNSYFSCSKPPFLPKSIFLAN
jgi:hypothetical protein